MDTFKRILKMPYVPLAIGATAVWFTGATYWYTCQTQDLCNDSSSQAAISAQEAETEQADINEEAALIVDPPVVTEPETVDQVATVPAEEAEEEPEEAEESSPVLEEVTVETDTNQAQATSFDTSQTVTAFYAADQAAFARTGWESTLDSFAEYLNENPSQSVQISGYAANVDNSIDEQSLSRERAQLLADYLTVRGVARSQINVVARGYEEPVGDNATAEGRAQNRRAVVQFN